MEKWDLDRLNYLFNDLVMDYNELKKENQELKDKIESLEVDKQDLQQWENKYNDLKHEFYTALMDYKKLDELNKDDILEELNQILKDY